jgi:hypothetical protein
VEMVVNYFAATIAHQHIIKLVCLTRNFQKAVGTAITAQSGGSVAPLLG